VLLGELVFVEFVLALFLIPCARTLVFIGRVIPKDVFEGGHAPAGSPFLLDGAWSVGANLALLTTVAAVGAWLGTLHAVRSLRKSGFQADRVLVFVAFLLAPMGLPGFIPDGFVAWRTVSVLSLAGFAILLAFLIPSLGISLAILHRATDAQTRRLTFSRRYVVLALAVWSLALLFSLAYGPLHPLESAGSDGWGPCCKSGPVARPGGEHWDLPAHGLAVTTLEVKNHGYFGVTLLGAAATSERARLINAYVGEWRPGTPKLGEWQPGSSKVFPGVTVHFEGPINFTQPVLLQRLAIPASATREITVAFRARRCTEVDTVPPVREVRLRYRLGSLTLTQLYPLSTPLALCETG
jgi:hypothetical protein